MLVISMVDDWCDGASLERFEGKQSMGFNKSTWDIDKANSAPLSLLGSRSWDLFVASLTDIVVISSWRHHLTIPWDEIIWEEVKSASALVVVAAGRWSIYRFKISSNEWMKRRLLLSSVQSAEGIERLLGLSQKNPGVVSEIAKTLAVVAVGFIFYED